MEEIRYDGYTVAEWEAMAGCWDAEAQYVLGRHHLGIEDDGSQQQAIDWLQQAAGQGHEDAIELLRAIES